MDRRICHIVGKTKNSFKTEIFNPSNLRKYELVFRERNGKPVMFLIVPSDEVGLTVNKANKVSKKRADIIGEIEEFFIQLSACVNPKLLNKQKAKGPKWSIKGVLNTNQGRPNKETSLFKMMFKGVDGTRTSRKNNVDR